LRFYAYPELTQGEQIMQNGYVKELATKTYQEELTREYYKGNARRFHSPSFIVGIFITLAVNGLF